MHVSQLSLRDFRSYREADVALSAGVTAFTGANGQGKTNLVEAVEYVATGGSHRTATDLPLVRTGVGSAVVRVVVQRAGREALVEVEINPGRSNRARVNRAPVPRAREALGIVRAVVFAPTDLALVKGDPGERRRFLDDLLVALRPKTAGLRADFDRVLRQRNSLLKTARATGGRGTASATLDVWDSQLARTGAELTTARLALVDQLAPHVARHYAGVAGAGAGSEPVASTYLPSWQIPPEGAASAELTAGLLAQLLARRSEEIDRGLTLVGPHRDDLELRLGGTPARGYASHGESWSLALALRLAAFDLLRADGDDPVLVLDDVFAELDQTRRARLAGLVGGAEQVLVTAAVEADLPVDLVERRFAVREGAITPA